MKRLLLMTLLALLLACGQPVTQEKTTVTEPVADSPPPELPKQDILAEFDQKKAIIFTLIHQYETGNPSEQWTRTKFIPALEDFDQFISEHEQEINKEWDVKRIKEAQTNLINTVKKNNLNQNSGDLLYACFDACSEIYDNDMQRDVCISSCLSAKGDPATLQAMIRSINSVQQRHGG